MKKTLLVTLEFPPHIGGVANYYSNICNQLESDNIFVLASESEDSEDFDKNVNYNIYRKNLITNLPVWPKWIFLFWYVYQIIRKEKISYLQVGHVLPVGVVALFFKKVLGIPYLVYIHGMDLLSAQRVPRKKMLLNKILKNADKIITQSEFNVEKIEKLGINKKNIELVYPGLDTDTYQKFDQTDYLISLLKKRYNLDNKKVLLTLGRVVERKGHDNVILAMPQIVKAIPDLVYVIAGSGEFEEKLKDLVDQYVSRNKSLLDNFMFLGEVSEEEKVALYKLCDVFIMPSRMINNFDVEGFGIVYLEANYFSKPVIGGRSGGVADAVLHNQTGLLVDPTDINQISHAVIKLFTEKEFAQKLGKQGQERVINEFNWSNQVEKLKKVLT